jgi:spermidine synthase
MGAKRSHLRRGETSYADGAMAAGADDVDAAWTYDEVARAESGRGEVVLRRRRVDDPGDGNGDAPGDTGVLELRVNGVFVMDTVETTTERELARAALERVDTPRDVLVGGLGLGFTAHEVLTDRRVERLVVVEVEEALVGWMRDGTVPHGPSFLADARLRVVEADLRAAVREAAPASFDLVLLDVDNGPANLVHQGNSELYRAPFLREVAATLREGGALVVWSAAEARGLAEALEGVFGAVASLPMPVRLQDREEEYWLYLARR